MQSTADFRPALEQAGVRWKSSARVDPSFPIASRVQLIRRAEYLHNLASRSYFASDEGVEVRAIELLLRRGEISDGVAQDRLLMLSGAVAASYDGAEPGAAEEVARCVGRVVIEQEDGAMRVVGCGVLVAPQLLATTSLVLPDRQVAASAYVDLSFRGNAKVRRFQLQPDRYFSCDALGNVVVRVEGDATLMRAGFCPLELDKGALLPGEGVHVVSLGTESNGPQIRLNDGLVRHLDESEAPGLLVFESESDMPPPGSAIFNAQWRLVGLQRIGVPMMDTQGHVLATDGTPWSLGGSSRIAWYGQEATLAWSLADLMPIELAAALSEYGARLLGRSVSGDVYTLRVPESPPVWVPGSAPSQRGDLSSVGGGSWSASKERDDAAFITRETEFPRDAPLAAHVRRSNPRGGIEFADNSIFQARVNDREHTVALMFATNRVQVEGTERFSGERSPQLALGSAKVSVPKGHRIGKLELPFKLSVLSFNIYKQKHSIEKHFTAENVEVLSAEEWRSRVGGCGIRDALIFVHGFNTTFSEALYRSAQLFWDLQYTGVPVLFTWPSKGGVLNYIYDKESALGARPHFLDLLRKLGEAGIEKIHILAHSMGNLVVLDSLATHNHAAEPLKIGELMMAAPDVDRDHYSGIAPKVRPGTSGMTLYASSEDKALIASRNISGQVARAGDVAGGQPVLVDQVDAIDVSAIGAEIFGLGHGPFATERSLLNDIGLLVGAALRPPSRRLREIRGMPDGQDPVQWWRFVR